MRKFLWLPVLLAVALVTAPALAQPVNQQFDKDVPARFPDLDQNRDYVPPAGNEATWCAPTAAANSVWYFGKSGYPELIPAGANDTAKADALITSLGGLMGTADPNGTTIANCVAGLSQYYANNTTTPFSVTWKNAWSFGGPPSAVLLWNWMCAELEKCENVLPIIWLGGPNGYAGPPTNDNEIEDTILDSVSGHLVTMTAYNIVAFPGTIDIHDPDDAAIGAGHTFPPVGAGPPGKVNYSLMVVGGGAPLTGTALQLTNAAGALNGGWIVGAIVASPVPEPSMLLLLGPAMGLLLLRMRRKTG